jgi:hypothetical protein
LILTITVRRSDCDSKKVRSKVCEINVARRDRSVDKYSDSSPWVVGYVRAESIFDGIMGLYLRAETVEIWFLKGNDVVLPVPGVP